MNVDKALAELTSHIQKYGNNKYQHSVIDTENSLKEPRFTLLTAEKYLARYLAHSGEKTGQVQDLLKAAHFILFEVQSRLSANKWGSDDYLKGVVQAINERREQYNKLALKPIKRTKKKSK